MADQGFFTDNQQEQQWKEYLHQQQAVSPGLELYRRGDWDLLRTPLESWKHFNPTPVPHPLHHDYSSIETAKRRKVEAERQDAQKKVNTRIRIHGVEQRAPWLPPDQYLPFQRGIPNIKNFSKPLRLRMPRL